MLICVVCIYVGACVRLCEYVLLFTVSQFQLPNKSYKLWVISEFSKFSKIMRRHPSTKVHGEGILNPCTTPYLRNKFENVIYVIHIVNCLNRCIGT